jgi:hypothetical protein
VVKNYIDTYGGTLNNADHANIADFANAANYTSIIGKPTFAQVAITGDYNNLSNVPSIANYATFSYVDSAVSNLINSAPAALNTLYELANAIANDGSFSSTVSSALGNRLRFDLANQNLNNSQKANAITNLGLATVASTGSYTDLTNKPVAFSTSYSDLTNKPALFSGSYTDLTNKPALFSGSYADLTNKPSITSTGNVTFRDVNIMGDGNLYLQPDPLNTTGYLDIYLTVGPNIHIAGNGENLILGRDSGANVMIKNDGNVSIQTDSGTSSYVWSFDNRGNLRLPDTSSTRLGEGFLTAGQIGSTTGIRSYNLRQKVIVNDSNVQIQTIDNSAVVKSWTFDITGNLTLPTNGKVNDSTGKALIVSEPSFTAMTSDFTATSGSRYGIDTTKNPVHLTLPANPNTGDAIYVMDFGYAFNTNNLVILRGGTPLQTIMNQSSDLTVSTNGQSFGLAYTGTTWRIYT